MLRSSALQRGLARAALGGTRHSSTTSMSASASGNAAGAPETAQSAAPTGPPKLIVFGGRGFVGSAVCQEALRQGLQVAVISRSGTPPPVKMPWVKQVEYLRGDALEPRTYEHFLSGAAAAVSCIGGFGNQEQMLRVNGTANAEAIKAARAAGIPRFVLVSAHLPPLPGFEVIAKGYVEGKRVAEDALFSEYPNTGVALRPWVIYGDRVVSSNVTLPLGAVFRPAELLIKQLPNSQQLSALPVLGAAFTPPVSVQAVARTAVHAATDNSVPGGIIDTWRLSEYDK